MRKPQAPRLGILGPVLRGVVGDYLKITFLNRTAVPLSMHPHGVKYDKDSEGSYYRDNTQIKLLQKKILLLQLQLLPLTNRLIVHHPCKPVFVFG